MKNKNMVDNLSGLPQRIKNENIVKFEREITKSIRDHFGISEETEKNVNDQWEMI